MRTTRAAPERLEIYGATSSQRCPYAVFSFPAAAEEMLQLRATPIAAAASSNESKYTGAPPFFGVPLIRL